MGRRGKGSDIAGSLVALLFLLLLANGPSPTHIAEFGHKLLLVVSIAAVVLLVLFVLYLLMKPRFLAGARSGTAYPRSRSEAQWHRTVTTAPAERPNQPVFPPTVAMAAQQTQPTEWSEDLIRTLEWKRFEELCEGFYREKGWTTRATRLGADGGVDIYLYGTEPEKPLGVIQCKAWNNYRVGVKPVRELYGVMAAEGVELGIFISSGDFTRDARFFADGKRVKLLTGGDLLKLIRNLPEASRERLLRQTTQGDYTTPTCPSCGVKMVRRTASRGRNQGDSFWGCVNYPDCRQIIQMRKP